jgi:hypothetical protein
MFQPLKLRLAFIRLQVRIPRPRKRTLHNPEVVRDPARGAVVGGTGMDEISVHENQRAGFGFELFVPIIASGVPPDFHAVTEPRHDCMHWLVQADELSQAMLVGSAPASQGRCPMAAPDYHETSVFYGGVLEGVPEGEAAWGVGEIAASILMRDRFGADALGFVDDEALRYTRVLEPERCGNPPVSLGECGVPKGREETMNAGSNASDALQRFQGHVNRAFCWRLAPVTFSSWAANH